MINSDSKTFDSIHLGKFMTIVRAYGTPEKIMLPVINVYVVVSTIPHPGSVFSTVRRYTFAPYLFIPALDYALRRSGQ